MAGRRRGAAALVLAALLVGAGCSAGVRLGSLADDGTLGREDGYRWDADLDVTAGDGLDAGERRAVVARTMARVERIRGLEFRHRVPVEVLDRETYRRRQADRNRSLDALDEQVFEALFLVGEDRTVGDALDAVYGSTVAGYYAPGPEEIVVVSDAATPRIDRTTLVHELVHALQDQHHSFGGRPATRDARLAADGLVEGDADAVEAVYERRCAAGWHCLPRPAGGAGGSDPVDQGVLLAVYAPYAAGPEFVGALRGRGGWPAVDAAYDRFPASTEQVIHPALYPDEKPVDVTVPDRAGGGWTRVDHDPVADTVGEASIYAMLADAGRVDREGAARFDYDHPTSAGWAGDALVAYRDGDRFGYVWRTRWDSPADARAFLEGYRGVLDARGAEAVGDGLYRIEAGRFADAFRVRRQGDTVVVVNAPTVDGLDAVHASG